MGGAALRGVPYPHHCRIGHSKSTVAITLLLLCLLGECSGTTRHAGARFATTTLYDDAQPCELGRSLLQPAVHHAKDRGGP